MGRKTVVVGGAAVARWDDVAVVAHHLLDSVAVIAGGAYTVRVNGAGMSTEERDRHLERIERHAQRLGAVLADLARGDRDGALDALLTTLRAETGAPPPPPPGGGGVTGQAARRAGAPGAAQRAGAPGAARHAGAR